VKLFFYAETPLWLRGVPLYAIKVSKRVGDDVDKGFGAVLSNGLRETSDDACTSMN
jgi:hypothetical protein